MTAAARVLRPLPGVRFEVAAPPLADVLPRMDIAVFVGIAASGPLHVPVAVEDAAHFESIFGADAPLASVASSATGENVLYAYLAPAVRAFFKNGGVRCWVIRVAAFQHAKTNVFPIPGLAVAGADGTMRRAHAIARSPGSWSDALLVGTALFARPFTLLCAPPGSASPSSSSSALGNSSSSQSSSSSTSTPPSWMGFAVGADGTPTVDAVLVAPSDVGAGDMLRVTFADAHRGSVVVMFIVEDATALTPAAGGPAAAAAITQQQRSWTRFTGRAARWFQTLPPSGVSDASLGTADVGGGVTAAAQHVTPPAADGSCSVVLSLPATAAPAPGSLIAITFGAETLWLTVDGTQTIPSAGGSSSSSSSSASSSSSSGSSSGPSPTPQLLVTGHGLWVLAGAPALASQYPLLERLSLRLSVVDDAGDAARLDDLGFAAEHPRALWALESDAELYGGDLSPVPLSAHETARLSSLADSADAHAALTTEARDPRFPLAAPSGDEAVYYPVGVEPVGGAYLGCSADPATALTRDGLDDYGPALFLDDALAGVLTTDLVALADAIRYSNAEPRALRGIHAALEIDEATLIAVPDAGQPGWYRDSATLPVPDAAPPPAIPDGAKFLACGPRVLDAPQWLHTASPDETGSYTLTWSPVAGATGYEIREATTARFEDALEVATVTQTSWIVRSRVPADYTYWIRADGNGLPAWWSAGFVVHVDAARGWIAQPAPDLLPAAGAAAPLPQASGLLDVQRALLRLCCARGDLFAVLSLPDGYRERDAVAHAAALRSPTDDGGAPTGGGGALYVPPLGFGEAAALAFGALYHPWPMSRDEGALTDVRKSPPDGAATGIMARRAIDRGAWISPANVALSGVVALTPPVPRDALPILQYAQVNALRQEARGFVCLGDDTLSADPDLLSINVRRLLSLLRRAALALGARYVFEPNDGRLARLVQRGFGGMLGTLFQRGAFAGSTAAEAYRLAVDTDPSSAAAAQGLFVVDVAVAPSVPLHFLTVRLVQTGDTGVITEPG